MRLSILITRSGLQNSGRRRSSRLLGFVKLGLQARDLTVQGGNLVAQLILPVLTNDVSTIDWGVSEKEHTLSKRSSASLSSSWSLTRE